MVLTERRILSTWLFLAMLMANPLEGASNKLPRHSPPVGATYKRSLSLPVIGKQTIELKIISDCDARIMISGRLHLDEPVRYSFSPEGQLKFELTDTTHRILRRFRTTLDAAGYDGATDTSWVVVWPPLPLSIRIQLKREETIHAVS